MVKKVCVKGGVVLDAYIDPETKAWMKGPGYTSMSDEGYAQRLEQNGWKLVNVVASTSGFHDKEMWFRKDE